MSVGIYEVKPWFVRKLRRVEDALVARNVSPNALTWAAVGVSVLAGAALAIGGLTHREEWWWAIPPLVVARRALNAMDGSVARRTGRASSAGAVLNELGDRAADTMMMAPAGFVARPALAVGAVAAAYVTSLTGVLGVAAVGARLQGGPMGKADRAAVIGIAALIGAAAGSAAPISAALWIVICGCAVTIGLRARTLLRPELRGEIDV
jgi:CDP-diacylglycerol--glycerol-3-phosphate 3-phosphatidyltransferase